MTKEHITPDMVKQWKAAIPVPLPTVFDANFLLIGESGSGKTRFCSTFPRPFFVDTDKGLESIPFPVGSTTVIEGTHTRTKVREGMHLWGTGWLSLMQKVDKIGALMDKGEWPYDTLVFDSLTTLQELAMNSVLRTALASNRYKHGDPIDPGLWGAQMNLIQGLVAEVRQWPGLKVFTAHIQKDTNTVTETVEKMALVTGKLAGKLPLYFAEVYFTQVEIGPAPAGLRKYTLRTYSDTVHRGARTRMDLPMGSEQDFKRAIWPLYVDRVHKRSLEVDIPSLI